MSNVNNKPNNKLSFKNLKVLLLGFLFLISAVAFADDHVMNFKEWQENRIREAQGSLVRIQIERADSIAKDNHKVSSSDVQQVKINVEIAKELTANDYFVLYIVPKLETDKSALLKAVQGMSSTEIADILRAYEGNLEEKKKSIAEPVKTASDRPGISVATQDDFSSVELFSQSKKPSN